MEFRILGPLEVIEDGQALDLGGQKQRALLAVLLLHANQVVSADRLIDALWPERPPDTAAKALQVYISQLRKTLGKKRVETRTPGYLLRIGEDELDLERCRRLAEAGKPGEALSLWRGSSLTDFAYERFAQVEIGRLEALRLACLEDRLDLDLVAGRHAAVVGELESLVAEYPLREHFRAQLMLALYRSGRQAEALDVYQAGRRLLADELGLEPGDALKSMQKAILAQDVALDLPSEPSPPQESEPAPAPAGPAEPGTAREVRKTVTVLVAAVESAGDAESLDPEAQRRLTSRAFAEIGAVVEQHGGTVETLAGDSLTAVFGVPVVHEDDALRAVLAATELGERLALRLGVSTGEVITGGRGSELPSTGRPITAAARLAQSTRPGEVLIDEATQRRVNDAVQVESGGDGLRVVAVRKDPVAPGSRFDTPMVGRGRERRRLRDVFDQAVVDSSCQLFTILGVAGVGKSRLVQEFLAELGDRATVVRGRCLPYGEGITYFPLLEAVKESAGLEDVDSREQGVAKIVTLLDDRDGAQLVARRVGELVGLAEIEPGAGAHESFSAVRSLFESMARRTPLVVVFDDIHWGQATFLELVEHLGDWTRDAPLLVVCMARPELLDVRPDWSGGKLNSTTVLLEPLSDAESAQLVDNLVRADGLGQETRQRIVAAAEGNPLFAEEMFALVLEGGQAHDELAVPPTIQALLAARLDLLGEDERAVIELAAVQGKEFWDTALSALGAEMLVDSVPAALASLVRKELIRPDRAGLGGPGYRFRHLLIRDAAYDAIPKESRAAMHERFGRWLERAAGARASEYEEIVGYHLERAYRYGAEVGVIDDAARGLAREAAEKLGEAGRRAFVRSDTPAGLNLVSRAAALLPADDPLRVELVPNVRAMQGMAGDMDWAERVLTEAVEVAATTGDRRLAAHALVQRGFLRLFTESGITPRELFDVAERAVAAFEELGDELGLARAWRLVAQAHYLDRHGARSAEASERALEHVRRAGDRFEETEIVAWLTAALALGSTPAPRAAERAEELLAGSVGNLSMEVSLLGVLGFLAVMEGRLPEAREFLDRGRRAMEEAGEVIWLYWLWALMAEPVSGERELYWAKELLERIGEKSHYSSTAAVLARATYALGRYDEAEELTRAAEEASRQNDVHGQVAWRSVRAKTLARRGELAAAEALAREALAFGGQSDFLNTQGHAHMDYAEVLTLAGRPDEAAAEVEAAIDLYERKGNAVAAAHAGALLAGIRRGS